MALMGQFSSKIYVLNACACVYIYSLYLFFNQDPPLLMLTVSKINLVLFVEFVGDVYVDHLY